MSDYTEHYQLHQWQPEDPFLRTDFNADLATIDHALGNHRTRVSSLEEKIAGVGNCGIHLTNRQGAGVRYTTYSITFPVQPVFVIIMGDQGGIGFFPYGAAISTCMEGGVTHELEIDWLSNTLTVHVGSSASVGLNNNELYYVYAFLEGDGRTH